MTIDETTEFDVLSNHVEPYQHLKWLVVVFTFLSFLSSLFLFVSFVGVFCFLTICFSVIQLGAMWAVFGPAAYWRTAITSFAACACPGLAALAGMVLVIGFDPWRDVLGLSLTIPAIWVFAQIPFWILRMFFNFRITTETNKKFNRPVSIGEMLTLTGLLAASFAVVRFVFPGQVLATTTGQNEFLELIVVWVSVTLGSFLFSVLPAMWCLLRTNSGPAQMVHYILIVLAFAFVGMISGSFLDPQFGVVVGVVIGLFGFTIGIPIASHRRYGFCLHHGHSMSSTTTS